MFIVKMHQIGVYCSAVIMMHFVIDQQSMDTFDRTAVDELNMNLLSEISIPVCESKSFLQIPPPLYI